MEIGISRITKADIEQIMPIEKASFPTPWTGALFEEALSAPITRAYVARIDGQENLLVGYVFCHLVIDELHILSLATHPRYLRKKVATKLFYHCLENNPQVKVVYLEVRAPNKPARAFYRKLGFEEIGRRKKYYSDTGEDAIVMAWNGEL